MRGYRSTRRAISFAGFLIALSITVPAVFGQAISGSISGTVIDPAGAVIAGANITITNVATNATRTTATDANGVFVFTNLAPGNYKVKIEKEGFGPQEIPNVQVLLGRDTAIKPTLQVGAAGGEVTVVGTEAVLIEKNSVQVTNNFEARKVTDLPIGNFFGGIDDLALLAPGVTPGVGFSNSNGNSDISVNGQRGRSNNFTIDGQENNDQTVAGPGFFVDNEEIVQEFQIVTNNFSAEFGRNQGAIVNIITKGGTNSMHGSVFYFHRDGHLLNALSPKERASGLDDPAKFISRRYGATLGGPMKKDKAFYFVSFQGTNIAQDIQSFGTLSSAVFTSAGLATLRAANPTNQLLTLYANQGPPARSLGTIQLHDFTTRSVGAVTGVEVAALDRSAAAPSTQYEFSGRIDYSIDARNQFSMRYLFQDFNNKNATGRFLAGYQGDVPGRSQNLGMTWTRQMWSRSVNELRVNYGRLVVSFGSGTLPSTEDVFGPKAITNVNLPSGFLDFGVQNNLPQSRFVNTYQAIENFSTQWREHTMKAGVQINRQHVRNFFLPNLIGTYNFGASGIATNSPASLNFVIGDPLSNIRETDQFYYFQDDWRYRPNLTLNLGIRYENTGQPINRLREIQLARESDPATAFFRQNIPIEQRIVPKIPNDNNNWAPRVGFAYSPKFWSRLLGEDRTVIRGGYSVAYDPAFFNIALNNQTAAPQVLAFTQSGGPGVFVPASGNPADVARQVNAPRNSLDPNLLTQSRVADNFHSPYAENWSFGVQREIRRDMVLEVRYVGTRGVGLFQTVNGNPFIQGFFPASKGGTGTVDFTNLLPAGAKFVPPSGNLPGTADNESADDGRVLKGVGLRRIRQNSAASSYNGLQTRFQSRLFKQLDLSVSYSWQHTIDNTSEIFSTFQSGAFGSQSPFNVNQLERGTSDLNFTHAAATSFIWDVNFFKNVTGVARHFLHGWQINGTWFLRSGQPWSPVQASAITETGTPTDDVNFALGFGGVGTFHRPYLSNPNAPITTVGVFFGGTLVDLAALNNGKVKAVKANNVRWIINNTEANTAFKNPFGVGRGLFKGQAFNNWNGGIFKNFKLSERVTFQFRTEFQNLFNHPFFGFPDNFTDDAGFGFGTTEASDSNTVRQIRFSGKFVF